MDVKGVEVKCLIKTEQDQEQEALNQKEKKQGFRKEIVKTKEVKKCHGEIEQDLTDLDQ